MTRKSEDNEDLFQQTGREGGQTGGQSSIETMMPENRIKRPSTAAAVFAGAGTKGATAVVPKQEAVRNSIDSRMDALLLASQILNGLGAYTSKGGRKRKQFYRRDLNWIADVLLRVDAGENNPLRPWGE